MIEKKPPYVPPHQRAEVVKQQAGQRPQVPEAPTRPIHWFYASEFNREIWEGAIRIYADIFSNGDTIEKPDYKLLSRLNESTGGQVVYTPLGDGNIPFEVRSIVHKGRLAVRVKAYRIKGRLSEDGEKFDEEMEKLLIEKGINRLTIGTAI